MPLTVVRKGAAVFELLASKDQTLLVGRDTLLVLNFGLDVVDRVRRLDFQSDCLPGEAMVSQCAVVIQPDLRLDKNLHDGRGCCLCIGEVILVS